MHGLVGRGCELRVLRVEGLARRHYGALEVVVILGWIRAERLGRGHVVVQHLLREHGRLLPLGGRNEGLGVEVLALLVLVLVLVAFLHDLQHLGLVVFVAALVVLELDIDVNFLAVDLQIAQLAGGGDCVLVRLERDQNVPGKRVRGHLPVFCAVGYLVDKFRFHHVQRHQLVVGLLVYLRNQNFVRRLLLKRPPERLRLWFY